MKSKKIIVLLLAVFILSIPGMAMAQGKAIYQKESFGTPGGWTTVWRQHNLSSEEPENKILEYTDLAPWLAYQQIMNSIAYTPAFVEVLSVNGVPWQIYDSPIVDAMPGEEYLEIPGAMTVTECIKSSMGEIRSEESGRRNPYSSFRQVLPTGDKKMVSIYQDNIVGAYYTSTTVEPKEMPGRPYADASTGRIMIPLRGVVDYLGAEITWDNALKTVVVKGSDKEIRLKAGKKTITVNGVKQETDTAPTIKDGVTFIPLRFVSEQLSYTIKWFGDKPADVPGNWPKVPRADIYN